MSFQRKNRVFGAHAAAVVFDLEEKLSSALDSNRDPLGSGVEAVFNQLLDDRRRIFHDFSGCDLIDHRLREADNFWAHAKLYNRKDLLKYTSG